MKTLIIPIILLITNTAYGWVLEPMSTSLENTQRTFQLTVNNPSNEMLAVKLNVFARDINDIGDDKLTPTHDVVIFPKRLLVGANKTAIVRVSIKKRNNSNVEKSYRIVAEQVPVQKKDDKPGIKILTKYVASLYLLPKQVEGGLLVMDSATISDNLLTLQVKNNTNVHKVLSVGNLQVTTHNGQRIDVSKKFRIVNIFPSRNIQVLLPIDNEILNHASGIEFHNNCSTCQKDERYSINL